MQKTIVTTGKTFDLAVEAALTQLGLTRDDVTVEILAQARPGFLGIGATPAKVQVTYEAPDLKPEAPKSALGSASRSKPKAAAPVKKPEAPKAAAKPQPKQEKPAHKPEKQPEEAVQAEEKQKSNHHRNHHRRRLFLS